MVLLFDAGGLRPGEMERLVAEAGRYGDVIETMPGGAGRASFLLAYGGNREAETAECICRAAGVGGVWCFKVDECVGCPEWAREWITGYVKGALRATETDINKQTT